VGLYLSVWARKRVARSMRGIQATSAATGWGGYLGNKGAVAVRLRVHDAPLVLVCSHLASGDAKGDEQRRNTDVAEIMRRCVFDNPDAQGEGGRMLAGGKAAGHVASWAVSVQQEACRKRLCAGVVPCPACQHVLGLQAAAPSSREAGLHVLETRS
jgi:hypothetical protein